MSQIQLEPEEEIIKRLRKPIDELIEEYGINLDDFQRLRLRQLAWQAVDILVKTGDIAYLRHEENIQRIINDIRNLGASEEFIEKSLTLAISIYKKMKVYYPSLLNKYGGGQRG